MTTPEPGLSWTGRAAPPANPGTPARRPGGATPRAPPARVSCLSGWDHQHEGKPIRDEGLLPSSSWFICPRETNSPKLSRRADTGARLRSRRTDGHNRRRLAAGCQGPRWDMQASGWQGGNTRRSVGQRRVSCANHDLPWRSRCQSRVPGQPARPNLSQLQSCTFPPLSKLGHDRTSAPPGMTQTGDDSRLRKKEPDT